MGLHDRNFSNYASHKLETSGTNYTPYDDECVGLAYTDLSGAWRLRFNVYGAISSSTSTFALAIAGVSFKGTRACAIRWGGNNWCYANTASGGTLFCANGTFANDIRVSGDVPLESKPDWIG